MLINSFIFKEFLFFFKKCYKRYIYDYYYLKNTNIKINIYKHQTL